MAFVWFVPTAMALVSLASGKSEGEERRLFVSLPFDLFYNTKSAGYGNRIRFVVLYGFSDCLHRFSLCKTYWLCWRRPCFLRDRRQCCCKVVDLRFWSIRFTDVYRRFDRWGMFVSRVLFPLGTSRTGFSYFCDSPNDAAVRPYLPPVLRNSASCIGITPFSSRKTLF